MQLAKKDLASGVTCLRKFRRLRGRVGRRALRQGRQPAGTPSGRLPNFPNARAQWKLRQFPDWSRRRATHEEPALRVHGREEGFFLSVVTAASEKQQAA